VKENQARKDADRHDALETDNKRLRESVEALERTKQKLETELKNKDRDLAEARSENDKMATKLKETADEHAKQLGELTNKTRASERNAQGLLAFVRCACLQMKDLCAGKRIEYAARLIHFSEQARKEANRLAELVENPEAHRELHAAWRRNLPRGPFEPPKLNPEQVAFLMQNEKEAIERSMQEDRDRFALECLNVIPEEVINQAFQLLGVSREEVVRQLDTEEQQRKA
jgi:hypothetical protein